MKKEPPPINYGSTWQRRLDAAVGFFSPAAQKQRMADRAAINLQLSYEGGVPTRLRNDPSPLRGPDSPTHQYQSIAMLRRAQDLVRNDGFFHSMVTMFQTYVIGDLQYFPQVGTKKENELYRNYYLEWMKRSDKTNRFHYIDQLKLAFMGFMANGDHGHADFHNEDGTYQIQDITGDCIGNPRELRISERYVRGVILDEDYAPEAVRIFRRTITDNYVFVRDIPLGLFTHFNPVETSDEIKAKTPFHGVLNDSQDIHEIEEAWKAKIKWAGRKTAVQNVPNGAAPEGSGLDRNFGDAAARGRLTDLAIGQEIYADPGFEINMVENRTPDTNEMDAVHVKLGKVAAALDVPLQFFWFFMGMPGTYARQIACKAQRTFEDGRFGQKWLQRTAIEKEKNNALFAGILRGEIPYTPNWSRGEFMFPPPSSIDEGNDTDADLSENRQGVTSKREIAAKRSRHWEDVADEIRAEAEEQIQDAIDIANDMNSKNPNLNMTWQDAMMYITSNSPNPKVPEKADGGKPEDPLSALTK